MVIKKRVKGSIKTSDPTNQTYHFFNYFLKATKIFIDKINSLMLNIQDTVTEKIPKNEKKLQ